MSIDWTKVLIVSTALVVVLGFTAIVYADAKPISVTLDDGTVIHIPEWGQACQFDEVYCPKGWLHDGSFPAVYFLGYLADLIEQCDVQPRGATVYCDEQDDDLTLSPSYCVER